MRHGGYGDIIVIGALGTVLKRLGRKNKGVPDYNIVEINQKRSGDHRKLAVT